MKTREELEIELNFCCIILKELRRIMEVQDYMSLPDRAREMKEIVWQYAELCR